MPGFGRDAVWAPFDYPERFHLGLFTRLDAPQDVKDFVEIARSVCRQGEVIVAH